MNVCAMFYSNQKSACLLSKLSFMLRSALHFHFFGLTTRPSIKISFLLLHQLLHPFLKLLPISILFDTRTDCNKHRI